MAPESEPATVDPAQGPSREEAALIRAAQRGDREAFERLVRAYDRGVLRLALNLLRSVEDAQEVYQETFLRAFRNLSSFRADSNFQTWLFRIASNVCLDYLRKRKVRREAPAPSDDGRSAPDSVCQLAEQRPEADPQRMLVNRELAERLERALASLTPRERMVFELRHYHGLRLRTIGNMMGGSEEAAKTCLYRATQKLRSALEDLL
ncbi:MAG: sigma-70 family RNA polymerase sigma factor [Bryobacterales bacterium]|nr:sigma-70 family RNA polymerase sigma factor [Bryobacterales bacterium]